MKKLALLCTLSLFSFIALMGQDARPIPGEYIVKIKGTSIKPLILQMQDASTDREANFKNASTLRMRLEGQLAEIAKRNGVSQPARVFVDATVALYLTNVSDDAAKRMTADPDVESVTPNFVPNYRSCR